MSRDQNAGQNCNVKMAILYFENVAKFEYLGRTPKHQTWLYEEIKRKLSRFVICSIQKYIDEYINRVFRSISLSLDFLQLLLRNRTLRKPAVFSFSGANMSGVSLRAACSLSRIG